MRRSKNSLQWLHNTLQSEQSPSVWFLHPMECVWQFTTQGLGGGAHEVSLERRKWLRRRQCGTPLSAVVSEAQTLIVLICQECAFGQVITICSP